MKSKNNLKYINGVIIICFLGLFVITRLFRITSIPSGLHVDEAGMAYDAFCLSNYGVDRYLNSYPLYLINYGGGQSILYAYILAGLFKFLPINAFVIRLPAVVSSFMTVLFGTLISIDIYRNNDENGDVNPLGPYIFLLAAILSPIMILTGRFGLDCFLFMGTSAAFLWSFCRISCGEQKLYFYVISGVLGGICLYTYALSYVIMPIFLAIMLLALILLKKINIKQILCFAVPLFFIALPLIIVQVINIFNLPELVLGGITFTKLRDYRVSEFHRTSIKDIVELIRTLIQGDDLYYIVPEKFTGFYYFSIPFFMLGLGKGIYKMVVSVRKKRMEASAILTVWFAVCFIMFCHLRPISYRMGCFYLPICFFISEGFVLSCDLAKKILKEKLSTGIVFSIASVCYLASFFFFGKYYYLGSYTADNINMKHFDILVTEGIDYVESNPHISCKQTQMAEISSYYGLSAKANPYEVRATDYDHNDSPNYICKHLGEIDTAYNYLVRDIYVDYSNDLRAAGFTEVKYVSYSLFYYED